MVGEMLIREALKESSVLTEAVEKLKGLGLKEEEFTVGVYECADPTTRAVIHRLKCNVVCAGVELAIWGDKNMEVESHSVARQTLMPQSVASPSVVGCPYVG